MPIPIVLYFLIGPAGAVLIIARAVARLRAENRGRWLIGLASAAGLAVWLGCSWILGLINFGVAMGMAHTRVRPDSPIPEGWPIYAATILYALVGLGLFIALARIPPKRAAA